MGLLNSFIKNASFVTTFLVLCFFPIFIESSVTAIFENRPVLYPPTEEEEMAVVSVIETFFDRINTSQVSDAYFLNLGQPFRMTISLDKFKQFVQPLIGLDYKENLKRRNVTFTSSDKKQATFFSQLKNPTGPRIQVEFHLENQDDEWQIIGIKIYAISNQT